jgi:hypothetical protein
MAATGQNASRCTSTGCRRLAAGGGNVVEAGSTEHGLYIVPLCSPCNGRSEEFEVDLPLIPVGVQKTCGYQERLKRGGAGQAQDANEAMVVTVGSRRHS